MAGVAALTRTKNPFTELTRRLTDNVSDTYKCYSSPAKFFRQIQRLIVFFENSEGAV